MKGENNWLLCIKMETTFSVLPKWWQLQMQYSWRMQKWLWKGISNLAIYFPWHHPFPSGMHCFLLPSFLPPSIPRKQEMCILSLLCLRHERSIGPPIPFLSWSPVETDKNKERNEGYTWENFSTRWPWAARAAIISCRVILCWFQTELTPNWGPRAPPKGLSILSLGCLHPIDITLCYMKESFYWIPSMFIQWIHSMTWTGANGMKDS